MKKPNCEQCKALELERARIVRERNDIYRIHLSQVAQSNEHKQQLQQAQQRVGELEAHERQTHERLGAILGTDDSLEEKAKQLKQQAMGLREATFNEVKEIINTHHAPSHWYFEWLVKKINERIADERPIMREVVNEEADV